MRHEIEKELLLARLHYLNEIHRKPGTSNIHPNVSPKVKEMILNGNVGSYMEVESLFNFLAEKLPEDESKAYELAYEMISFIN